MNIQTKELARNSIYSGNNENSSITYCYSALTCRFSSWCCYKIRNTYIGMSCKSCLKFSACYRITTKENNGKCNFRKCFLKSRKLDSHCSTLSSIEAARGQARTGRALGDSVTYRGKSTKLGQRRC